MGLQVCAEGGFCTTLEDSTEVADDRDRKGRFQHTEFWNAFPVPGLSPECKRLVNKLLDPDPSKRLTAIDTQKDKWVTSGRHATSAEVHEEVEARKKVEECLMFRASSKSAEEGEASAGEGFTSSTRHDTELINRTTIM